MPIIPNFIERLVFRFNLAPPFMLDFLGAQAFRVNTVAFKLGLVTALSDGPRTAAELAHKIKVDERGVTLLLDALVAIGSAKKHGTTYALSPSVTKWLPTFSAHSVAFFERLVFDQWNYLGDSIRTGGSAMPPMNADTERDLQAGMIAMAGLAADEIVGRAKLPSTARRLLDVGGGHGLYAIKFCQRNPGLTATIFDSRVPLETAREMIARERVQDRVQLQEGNFLRDDIGKGYDVALIFNVIHYDIPDKTGFLRKVAGALNPGGVIIIMDQISGRIFGPTVNALIRLQALHLYNATSGQTHSFEEISRWLGSAGLHNVRRIVLRKSIGHALVLGTKPS
jgi:2-polyprenyl-3-methyl-5-hydroxy-6-metoxy-1,4-benzoquinol methylase